MRAVVLGTGPSLIHFDKQAYKNDFVVGSNDIIHRYKVGYGEDLKLDLLCVCDRYAKVLKTRPRTLDTPQDVEGLVLHSDWDNYCSNHPNFKRVKSARVSMIDGHWQRNRYVHGHTSTTFAVFECIKRGCTQIHVYGHDLSAGHNLHNDVAIALTIKELNFANSLVNTDGGYVALHHLSGVWQHSGKQKRNARHKNDRFPILDIPKIALNDRCENFVSAT